MRRLQHKSPAPARANNGRKTQHARIPEPRSPPAKAHPLPTQPSTVLRDLPIPAHQPPALDDACDPRPAAPPITVAPPYLHLRPHPRLRPRPPLQPHTSQTKPRHRRLSPQKPHLMMMAGRLSGTPAHKHSTSTTALQGHHSGTIHACPKPTARQRGATGIWPHQA